MELLKVMEIVTLVVTIFMFFSGILPSIEMYKTGDTRNVPYYMFLLSTVSCLGMFHYGLIIDVMTLALLNALGAFLNAIYTGLYLLVVKDKSRPVLYLSLSIAYMAALYGYLYTALDTEEARGPLIGATSSYITTFLMTLPGLELVGNFRNHNAEGMPIVMTVMGMVCGFSWLIYGLMLGDINIVLPNIPGLSIGVGKVIVHQLYGQDLSEQKKKKL